MTEREAGPAGCFSVDTRLQQVGELFASYPGSWWIAGGWAVDLHVGRVRRAHADVDVLVLARELEQFSDAFADRGLVVTDRRTGERRPWAYPQEVEPGRETLGLADGPPGLEVLVGAAEGADWVFHRGRRSRRPLAELTRRGPGGLPYLSPEVVLLFKARDGRDKDELDFRALAPLLTADQRAWLAPRLSRPGDEPHRWAAELVVQ
ncbi:nucleotidyltransferase domain-containing protein [Kitasatospora sp. MAP12-22]|uniref:nucleotidyltransferase domain-containing protein n=1 Tax=unclassified Kitasatospora TaxID=2633591 RepID=UPI003516B338